MTCDIEPTLDQPHPLSGSHRCRAAMLILSIVLGMAVTLVYFEQPDWLAAVTLVPPWFWFLPAIGLTLIGWHRQKRRLALVAAIVWLVFALLHCDEIQSLPRGLVRETLQRQRGDDAQSIRVLTLNCANDPLCLNDVVEWGPDIVLLQESPSEAQLVRFGNELFGGQSTVLSAPDTAIVVGGRASIVKVHDSGRFVCATVTLDDEIEIDVISLRLSPPVPRVDFWTFDFWRAHRGKRIQHRAEIAEVVEALRLGSGTHHRIVGGDFNVPPGDGSLRALRGHVDDTFTAGGLGWGGTGTNEWPLFRVDQIHSSESLRPAAVIAYPTGHSDHRMVICDFKLAGQP